MLEKLCLCCFQGFTNLLKRFKILLDLQEPLDTVNYDIYLEKLKFY